MADKELTIFEKLAKVQAELKAPKNQYNSFGKYHYRSCEDIIEAVKPLLNENGLLLLMNDEIVFIEGRFYVKATARLIDVKTESSIETQAFAREAESKSGSDLAQLTGACSTYARKYALNALFAVDDTKDADTDENAAETQARANKGTNKAAPKPAPKKTEVNEPPPHCMKCKNAITATDKFTVEQIIDNSKKYLKGIYCFACGQKIAAEIKAAKEQQAAKEENIIAELEKSTEDLINGNS